MKSELERRLAFLEWSFGRSLDRLHDELLAKLETMARSTGQRTRTDRLLK